MHDAGDKWDVFVVGVRDASHAKTVAVAAQLAKSIGMPTAAVELALMKGDVRVRSGLLRPAAQDAAMEFDGLGAIVDLRLADGKSSPFLELKPDASRRAGVAVGGFIDDSATPPRVAESTGLTPVPLEPDAEGLPPPPPMGVSLQMLEDIASEPIRIGPDAYGEPTRADYDQAMASLAGDGAPALGEVGDTAESDKAVVDVPFERNPKAPPPVMNRASAAPAWVHGAAPDAGAPGPTLFGIPDEVERPPSVVPKGGHTQHGLAPGPAPVGRDAARRGASGREANRGSAGRPRASERPLLAAAGLSHEHMIAGLEALELTDLPTAPKQQPPPERRAKRPTPPPVVAELPPRPKPPAPTASAALELDYEAAGAVSRQGPAAPAASMSQPAASHASASAGSTDGQPVLSPTFLLGRDVYTAIPAGLAVGLALSLLVAIQWQRGVDAETVKPLEAELQTALSAPSRVEAGEVRAPHAVEEALDEAYGSLRHSFLLKWLAIGLPIGFALSRIRRAA